MFRCSSQDYSRNRFFFILAFRSLPSQHVTAEQRIMCPTHCQPVWSFLLLPADVLQGKVHPAWPWSRSGVQTANNDSTLSHSCFSTPDSLRTFLALFSVKACKNNAHVTFLIKLSFEIHTAIAVNSSAFYNVTPYTTGTMVVETAIASNTSICI